MTPLSKFGRHLEGTDSNPGYTPAYIDFPDWIKNKKSKTNPINNDDNKCFQYATTIALNNLDAGKKLVWMSKIKPLMDKTLKRHFILKDKLFLRKK